MTASSDAQAPGFDLSLIEMSLQRTYDERAIEHQAALELALELEMIGRLRRESTEQIASDPL